RRSVPCVTLDATHLDAGFLKEHFPTIHERCLSVGIDITREPIPVVPAQHYQCGGVVTDLDGATNIPRLYAAGEVACTGVHGANRLASNSLLEAMVFGYRAAQHTVAQAADPLPANARLAELLPEPPAALEIADPPSTGALRAAVRQTMQQRVGIVRTTADLEQARCELENMLQTLAARPATTAEAWEAGNIAQVGLLIVECALRRHESRGLHFTLDYPEPVESERHDTVLSR
ncbi:MAG TPA: FAD-binding protein, partial [Chthonomonadaceae bacterium]|nr:FAD-binding protein [Chthonomonadaceae bacterium]